MDRLSGSINRFFGVYPDNIKRRVTIAIIVAVIGAIAVLLGLLYTFSSFTTTLFLSTGGIKETTQLSQNIGMFMMFIYALFIGSLMYYVFLPWKPKEKTY